MTRDAMGRKSRHHRTITHSDQISQFARYCGIEITCFVPKGTQKAATFNTPQFRSIESPLRRFTIRDWLVRASLYLDADVFIERLNRLNSFFFNDSINRSLATIEMSLSKSYCRVSSV